MNRIRDEFDRLHEEEQHVRDRSIWGKADPSSCSLTGTDSGPTVTGKRDWPDALAEAISRLAGAMARQKESAQLEVLEAQVRVLAGKVEELRQFTSILVHINTLGPGPFELLKPIEVAIQSAGEEDHVASFFDANVNASGCNPTDAFANLVEVIQARFDTLENLPLAKLGKGPRRQLEILREFIRRKA